MVDHQRLETALAVAATAADAARAETMTRFRRLDLTTDNKLAGRGYDPVTEADRAAETAIRGVIARHYPDDGIFGEEEARTGGTSGWTWVVDPIDGTRAYLCGLPTWGTLIALDDGQRGCLGIVDHPATGERFMGLTGPGRTPGAWMARDADGARIPLGVRKTTALAGARLMTTAPELFGDGEREGFERVRAAARLTRYGTDCYAYAMLAAGQIDLVIETGLAAYDIAAPKAVVEAAGGTVTDWEGGDCRWGGRTVAAATQALAEAALDLMAARTV
ncbi:MAG: inositol monophosphatase family protein [Pseudomonadota bacterium]